MRQASRCQLAPHGRRWVTSRLGIGQCQPQMCAGAMYTETPMFTLDVKYGDPMNITATSRRNHKIHEVACSMRTTVLIQPRSPGRTSPVPCPHCMDTGYLGVDPTEIEYGCAATLQPDAEATAEIQRLDSIGSLCGGRFVALIPTAQNNPKPMPTTVAAVNWDGIARFLGQPTENIDRVRRMELIDGVKHQGDPVPDQPPIHFQCPTCGAEHRRGFVDGVSLFRCLRCGYQGHGSRTVSATVEHARVLSPEKYTYRVMWSEEDQEHVGLCAEFPSLSWLAKTHGEALSGIVELVAGVLKDSTSAESGGGLTGVVSDIHGAPEPTTSRDLRELVGDDEAIRRQALIDAIGITEFAGVEWTVIVNHVRLMRENWDHFVADAASYKKRLDRELQVAQAESASWKQAHAELNADLQAKRNDLDFRRRQLCTATGVREDSAWECTLADVKERWARVTAAHEAGVKMWREIEPRRAMQLPPTRTDLVAWMLTRIEDLEREHASEIANIKHAFAHIGIELRNEHRAIRDALQAREDETTLDAAKRWVSTAMNEAALLNDIDEARGMLCGELVIDDPGNTVEVMRQAALAIARHRLSTEAISKIRAELAAIEAKSSAHRSDETDHSQCGLGTVDDGPRDSDCPCRTGADLSTCAAAGCGFCQAEISMRTRQRQGSQPSAETLNAQLRVLRNNWANDPEIALQEVLTDVDELLVACSTHTTDRRDG